MIVWEESCAAVVETAVQARARMLPHEVEADLAYLRARAAAKRAAAAHRQRECYVWEDGYVWADEIEEPPTDRELADWQEPEGDPFSGSDEKP